MTTLLEIGKILLLVVLFALATFIVGGVMGSTRSRLTFDARDKIEGVSPPFYRRGLEILCWGLLILDGCLIYFVARGDMTLTVLVLIGTFFILKAFYDNYMKIRK